MHARHQPMQPEPRRPEDSPAPARLLIHAAAAPLGSGGYLAAAMQWLRGCVPASPAPQPGPEQVLRLSVDDLQGRRVFNDDAAGPLVALDLPVGTYHVTAVLGNVCRSYTLTLVPGNAFDLYLCPSLRAACR